MRKVLIGVVVLSIMTAFGTAYADWDVQGTAPGINQANGSASIEIECEIPPYIQIIWQEPTQQGSVATCKADLTIAFTDSDQEWTLGPEADGGGTPSLKGYYHCFEAKSEPESDDWPSGEKNWCAGKPPTDPWAHAWFESLDQAQLYINTNTNLTMTVTPQGKLNDGSGHELPSWFTMCGTGLEAHDGFLWGGAPYTHGDVPTVGRDGAYFADKGGNPNSGSLTMLPSNPNTKYPSQYCFAMEGGPWIAHFDPPTRGTIVFHARIFRDGMNDVAGVYTGTIKVDFSG